MKAYIYPGQGSQFVGMGQELYETSDIAKEIFDKANEILGFNIKNIMFSGTDEDLKQTKVTQPSVFIHSVAATKTLDDFQPDMVAGHSLGEFSALVANGCLSFENGLQLVAKRAFAMQKACEAEPSTMAAILGLEDDVVEEVVTGIDEVIVPANYNSPGQLVISGSIAGIDIACEKLIEAGAKRVIKLPVGGAFHSPLMLPAQTELEEAINETTFDQPLCAVYQNVNASPTADPNEIKANLVAQLTSPVRWAQSVEQMIQDGATSFIEVGPGKVLQGLVKKIDKEMETMSASLSE
ncbi:MAG: ACP S-malonyltransferase [Bacteroidetes bacterium]|nr:ACP S-malonyltransferase [Bacteroidota bacterium]